MDQTSKYYATWNHDFGDDKVATSPQDFIGPFDTEQQAVDACIALSVDVAKDDGCDYESRYRVVQVCRQYDVSVKANISFSASATAV